MPHRLASRIEEAESLLRRGTAVSSEHLVRLIHEVNPTARGLRDADTQRRYALKARLQSLLIRRFGEELEIAVGPDPGVVSLLHRMVDHDACHAVVDELDDDARSWIHFQLDIAAAQRAEQVAPRAALQSRSEAPEPQTSSKSDAPERLISDGRGALEEYDFETAERCFEQALRQSQGGVDAARALLELWIDQLGNDTAAAAIEERLPKSTMADPEVRAMVALAAARLGNVKHAESLMRGVESPRLVEILVLAARAACRLRDRKSAEVRLAQLRTLDPMHPAIDECERELRAWQDDERQAAERELERYVEQGDNAAAERCAKALVQRFGNSTLAVNWLRRHSAERAKIEATHALQLAEAELARGALRDAAITLNSALTAELEDPAMRRSLTARLASLERQLREQAEQEQSDRVVAALEAALTGGAVAVAREPQFQSALDAYFELALPLRARVRERLRRPELAWIDPLIQRLGTRRARLAAQAVLILVEQESALAARPIEALAGIEPLADLLENIPEAARRLADARRAARLERQRLASERIAQAEMASSTGDWGRALELVESIALDDLLSEQREYIGRLRGTIQGALARQALRNEFRKKLEAGDRIAARDLAARLASESPAAERPSWQTQCAALRQQIARTYCLETGEDDTFPLGIVGLLKSSTHAAPARWIDEDAKLVVLPIHAGPWVLLIRYDLARAKVNGWARLYLPEPNDDLEFEVTGKNTLRIICENSSVLSLDVERWDILACVSLSSTEGWRSEETLCSRDGRTLWCMETRDQFGHGERVRLRDAGTGRVIRELQDVGQIVPVIGSGEAECAVVVDFRTSLHTGRGALVTGFSFDNWMTAVVEAPSGRGWIATYGDSGEGNLVLVGPTRPGEKPRELALEKSIGERIHHLALARESKLIAVTYFADDGRWLESLIEDGDRLKSIYRVSVAEQAIVLSDRGGHRAWLFGFDQNRVACAELKREAPRVQFEDRVLRRLPNGFMLYHDVMAADASSVLWLDWGGASNDDDDDEEETEDLPADDEVEPATHSGLSGYQVWQHIEELQAEATTLPSQLFELAIEMSSKSETRGVARLLGLVTAWAFPDDPRVALIKADRAARNRDWAGVHRQLLHADLARLESSEQKLALHLGAWSAQFGRDSSRVSALLQRAKSLCGSADFGFIDAVTGKLDDAPSSTSGDSQITRGSGIEVGILALRRALRDGTAYLDQGNAQAALDVVWIPELLDWHDQRHLAVAVEALIRLEPANPGQRLLRQCVLGRFLYDFSVDLELEPAIPLREEWDAARISEVRARAERLLSTELGVALTPRVMAARRASALAVQEKNDRDQSAVVDPNAPPALADLPTAAHLRVTRCHPGIMQGYTGLVAALGKDACEPLVGRTESELLAIARARKILAAEHQRLIRPESDDYTIVSQLEALAPHLGYWLQHQLAGCRSYWVSEYRARQLRDSARANQNWTGFGSRRDHWSITFMDRGTLELAERLPSEWRRQCHAVERLIAVSAYVWPLRKQSASDQLALRLALVPEKAEAMPRLIARELSVEPPYDLEVIVQSHRVDRLEAALEPYLDTPELAVLIRLALDAVRHAADPESPCHDLGRLPGATSLASATIPRAGVPPMTATAISEAGSDQVLWLA